jgi:hypothetical protein
MSGETTLHGPSSSDFPESFALSYVRLSCCLCSTFLLSVLCYVRLSCCLCSTSFLSVMSHVRLSCCPYPVLCPIPCPDTPHLSPLSDLLPCPAPQAVLFFSVLCSTSSKLSVCAVCSILCFMPRHHLSDLNEDPITVRTPTVHACKHPSTRTPVRHPYTYLTSVSPFRSVIMMTHSGYIKRLPIEEFEAQSRGGKVRAMQYI